jgi:hypothetical protein
MFISSKKSRSFVELLSYICPFDTSILILSLAFSSDELGSYEEFGGFGLCSGVISILQGELDFSCKA